MTTERDSKQQRTQIVGSLPCQQKQFCLYLDDPDNLPPFINFHNFTSLRKCVALFVALFPTQDCPTSCPTFHDKEITIETMEVEDIGGIFEVIPFLCEIG